MKGIRIEYGGVAVGAKDSFVPTTTDKASFVNMSDIHRETPSYTNYGNPCELYSVLLDGKSEVLPDDLASANLGWWSDQVSGEDGKFDTPIVLTLTSDLYFTSSGITLVFDTYNDIYANDISVRWYRDTTLIREKEFNPDTAYYFCQEKIEKYNKLVITFNGINMPGNRLKLHSIEYGIHITFYGEELRKCKLIQEIDPISSQIAINTCDFTIDSKRSIEYSFQERQPISVYFNDVLRSTTFITSAKRKQKNIWEIQSEDYIGLMESITYYGGIYADVLASDIIDDIFTVAGVPYEIMTGTPNIRLSGHIPLTNCREALMQVAFAIGAVVDTSNSDKVIITHLSNNTTSHYIGLERIMQGQNFTEDSTVTGLEIASHNYIESNEEITVYDAAEEGTGDNIIVKFTDPMYSLSIENGDILFPGNDNSTITTGTNYAVINARSGCILKGKRYEHRQHIYRVLNELAQTAGMIENIVSIKDATLISSSNLTFLLSSIQNYYFSQTYVNLKIVEGKHRVTYGNAVYGSSVYYGEEDDDITHVGDILACQTEYLGDVSGRILKQTFDLNGGIVIKDTRMKRSKNGT